MKECVLCAVVLFFSVTQSVYSSGGKFGVSRLSSNEKKIMKVAQDAQRSANSASSAADSAYNKTKELEKTIEDLNNEIQFLKKRIDTLEDLLVCYMTNGDISVFFPEPALQQGEEHLQDEVNLDISLKESKNILSRIDQKKYAATWEDGSEYFKNTITRDRWIAAVSMARRPLGRIIERTLISGTVPEILPGSSKGTFAVFQYSSSFTHKKSALETVTLMQCPDGHWRLAGYYIK
jgi:hypothetical protein